MSNSSARVDLGARAEASGAGPVDRPVDDDPMQPRPERTAAVETVEVAHRGEERLLRDVLGGGRVLHDEIRGPVSPRPVLAEERLEVRGRSRLRAPNPGALLPAGAHHRALTIRADSATRSIRGPAAERSGTFPEAHGVSEEHETPTSTPRAPCRLRSPLWPTRTAVRPSTCGTTSVAPPGSTLAFVFPNGRQDRSGPTTSAPAASDSSFRAACSPRTAGSSSQRFRRRQKHTLRRYDTRTGRGRRYERLRDSGTLSESRPTAAGSPRFKFRERCAGDDLHAGRSGRSEHRSPPWHVPARFPLARTAVDSSSSTGIARAGYDLQQYDRASRLGPDAARRARREDDRARTSAVGDAGRPRGCFTLYVKSNRQHVHPRARPPHRRSALHRPAAAGSYLTLLAALASSPDETHAVRSERLHRARRLPSTSTLGVTRVVRFRAAHEVQVDTPSARLRR